MGKHLRFGLWTVLILVALGACQEQQPEQQVEEVATSILRVESDAFVAGESIPQRYTCDGEDVSPPLSWSQPPAAAQSLVLIFDDPDAPAGTWDHWLLFNIPPTTRSLPEGLPASERIQGIGVHGSNSWRRLGYGGPCPPTGTTHRYYLKLYALDSSLDLDAGASKRDIETAIKGHVLAKGELMARYGR